MADDPKPTLGWSPIAPRPGSSKASIVGEKSEAKVSAAGVSAVAAG